MSLTNWPLLPCKAICVCLREGHEYLPTHLSRKQSTHEAQWGDTFRLNSHVGQNDGSYHEKPSSILRCLAGSGSIVCDFLIDNWIPLPAITSLLQIWLWWLTKGTGFNILTSIHMQQFPHSRAEKECGHRVLLQGILMVKDTQRVPLFYYDFL